MHNYQKISGGVVELVSSLKETKNELNIKTVQLGGEQDDARQMLSIQTIQQEALASKLTAERVLYKETAGKETNYQAQLAEYNPSFLRFHASEQNKCDNAKSWLDCVNKTWDKAKIQDILEEFIPAVVNGDQAMVTVFNYPPWTTTKTISEYAQWCADLVSIVNEQWSQRPLFIVFQKRARTNAQHQYT